MAETPDPSDQIRQIVQERVAAVHAKDPKPLAARQAPDVITFDVLPPLQALGNAAGEERTQAWFDGYASPIGYDVEDVNVWAAGDLGFCSFVYHVSGTLVDGGEVDMWVRATLGLERVDGQWLIVHDHESAPFEP